MALQAPGTPPRPIHRSAFLVLLGIWSLVVGGMLLVILHFSRLEARRIALNRAMDSYHKDLAYRRWASERGGVYVPRDARTPPNPQLANLPERDVTTTSGQALTLVNPAYMTRMVHEQSRGDYGLRGHITSLNPLRPENAPDAWEQKALRIFERGAREYSEVLDENGQPVLRFMGAFLVEQSCLACHEKQGYKVGDVRGGISVTVPVGSPPSALGLTHRGISTVIVLAFWLLGGVGLLGWRRRNKALAIDQKRMVAELEESTQRFRQLFESSPAPMVIHQHLRFIHANDAAARLLDAASSKVLLGRDVLDIVHPDFRTEARERIRSSYERALPAGPVQEVFVTLSGRQVWTEVQTVPLDLQGGPATLVFARDLTEHRRAEEDRRKLEVEFQHSEKLESLGSLAGGIAHDMNNVLAAVLGLSSLLQTTHEGDAALVKSLQTIENAAARGRDLVKGLTDFARKDLQEPQVLDLNALIRQELDLLVRTTRQRFTFDIQLADGILPILGEPSTLGSAFMNLCVNAFDAMPRGGTLRVETALEGSEVRLLVADSGEGIPPELLPRVAEPFFTTKPAGRGTGLGLAMVYGTMQAHRGSLDIQSEVGRGTSITLVFPAASPEDGEKGTAPSSPADPAGPLRILLVDDDELIRSVLPSMLQRLGHTVATSSGGLEALRRLDAGLEVDLVILDHHMPGMSGTDVLPRILQLRPDTRIILATGFLDPELRIFLADFPSVRILQKPFTQAELTRALQGIR